MDKEKVIKQLDDLKDHCEEMKRDGDEIWGDDVEALKTAIASVKAINKIKEEVDKLTVYHTTAQGSELLSKNAVIRLINKHLEESEG